MMNKINKTKRVQMPQEYAYFIHIEFFSHLSYWFFRFFSNNKQVTQSIFFDKAKNRKKMKNEKKPHHFLKDRGQ